MQQTVEISTPRRETLVDITEEIARLVRQSDVKTGIVSLYVQGATGGVMIQENWDDSVQTDVVEFLRGIIPQNVWLHDRQDGNGDAHIKAGLVGPSETIPIIDGRLGLSRWQNIFFCEFDGPRKTRAIVCTFLKAGND